MDDIKTTQKIFLGTLAGIVVFGIVMVYSSSYLHAKELFGHSNHFFLRQFLFLAIGLFVAFVVGKTRFYFWMKYGHGVHLVTTFLLFLTLIPHISIQAKGASRWLDMGGFYFQPGELVKITILVASWSYFELFPRLDFKEKLFKGTALLLPLFLLVRQPDFGSFMICFLGIGFTCYLGSMPKKYFYTLLLCGIFLGSFVLFNKQYRIDRLLAFLDPWQSPQGAGFQVIQSFLAFANGSLWGQGLGNSKEKLFYLPEAHNDFIFSVIGEEWGFMGVLFLVSLFIIFIYTGLKLSLESPRQSSLLIASIMFLFGMQTLFNMGVVLGLLPTKGLNLPFISYGGSSLVSNFFGVGLILSALKEKKSSLSYRIPAVV